MRNISDWIRGNAVAHYSVIKNEPGFPGECVLSSHLLGTYLGLKFPEEHVRIVYGTFGDSQLFHSWLVCEDGIVDLTLFQFLTHKEKVTFYKRSSGEDILEYALEHQGDILISPGNAHCVRYHELVDVAPIFGQFFCNQSYETFLQSAVESGVAKGASWSESSLKDVAQTFYEWIEEHQLRITRRFFSKWAIVPA